MKGKVAMGWLYLYMFLEKSLTLEFDSLRDTWVQDFPWSHISFFQLFYRFNKDGTISKLLPTVIVFITQDDLFSIV